MAGQPDTLHRAAVGAPRLAVLSTHPVQYYAPLLRALARRIDLHVFYALRPTPEQQGRAGFATPFAWDVDLTGGYSHSFVRNVARRPDTSRFSGCNTPQIGDELARGDFDAVLCMGWHVRSLLQGIVAARRLGLPVMVRGDSHAGTPRSAVRRAVKAAGYPALLRVFSAGLYVGSLNKAYYESYHYPSRRLFHAPHCVDNARFAAGAGAAARARLRARLGLPDDAFAVLMAGKLIGPKRPLDGVMAVARARAAGLPAQLVVAGAGPLEAALRERARALDVPLHLLGFCNQSQMPAIYAGCDVLLLPSAHETWGLVCNEALASGTPILVSDAVGCAPDLAGDGRAGRIFGMGDIEACGEALMAMAARPPDRSAMADVAASHDISKAVDGIVAAMAACTSEASGGLLRRVGLMQARAHGR